MTVLISLNECEAIAPGCVANILFGNSLPKSCGIWRIENEIKPSDLFCYLYSKFGPPNGIQNFLRSDDSDNLIHWDWTLAHSKGLITILGLNMRTEVQLLGDWDFANCDRQQFIDFIKNDFAKYGKQMSQFRSETLEDWDMFVNPYQLLRKAITQLKSDLDSLALNPEAEQMQNPQLGGDWDDHDKFKKQWGEVTARYNRGVGLSMALRAMTPVLAESYINLLFFILCRPDIKKNERLYNSNVRANIDIKVQSLHINCIGFKTTVDWTSTECRRYNSVINERNDMLHGNVVIEKLKFSEIHFLGKVPVFKNYKNIWQQSIGVAIDASGMNKVLGDLETVDNFIAYIAACLEPDVKERIDIFANQRDLGLNKKNGRLGVLLPEHIVDFGLSDETKENG